MSQQMLKQHSPASLLAPKVQVARVFTTGHRHARSARTLVKPCRASREEPTEDKAALSSGGPTTDHLKHNMQVCRDAFPFAPEVAVLYRSDLSQLEEVSRHTSAQHKALVIVPKGHEWPQVH